MTHNHDIAMNYTKYPTKSGFLPFLCVFPLINVCSLSSFYYSIKNNINQIVSNKIWWDWNTYISSSLESTHLLTVYNQELTHQAAHIQTLIFTWGKLFHFLTHIPNTTSRWLVLRLLQLTVLLRLITIQKLLFHQSPASILSSKSYIINSCPRPLHSLGF